MALVTAGRNGLNGFGGRVSIGSPDAAPVAPADLSAWWLRLLGRVFGETKYSTAAAKPGVLEAGAAIGRPGIARSPP